MADTTVSAAALIDEMEIANVALEGVDEAASGLANEMLNLRMDRDRVLMYHPDGSYSRYILPPLGPNGRGKNDRKQRIVNLILNKRGPDGEQWLFPTPPAGWQEKRDTMMKLRCPVTECTRRGGVKDPLNLYRHIMQKHPGEAPLYQGVLNAIQDKLGGEIPAELAAQLGLGEKEHTPMLTEHAACDICQKTAPAGHHNPQAWVRGHKMAAHPGGE